MRLLSLITYVFAISMIPGLVPLTGATEVNLTAPPARSGCPVEISVTQQTQDKLLLETANTSNKNYLHIALRSVAGNKLRSAEIVVRGFSSESSLIPASTGPAVD